MFEQPGVANIRERKAANEARQRREREGDNSPPRKGTIDHLVWVARQNTTPEDKARRVQAQLDFNKRMREYEADRVKRNTCGDCGADTLNYSHSFKCRWRGSGF
jgi:hypothetical protein